MFSLFEFFQDNYSCMFIPLATAEILLKGGKEIIGLMSQLRVMYTHRLLGIKRNLAGDTLRQVIDPYNSLDTELGNLDAQGPMSADPKELQKQVNELFLQKSQIYLKYIEKAIENKK